MTIVEILKVLDRKEIDFRIESNHCVGYNFYFLDAKVYPRRYYDMDLEGEKETVITETVEHMIKRSVDRELKKDWLHRIEAENIEDLFMQVEKYLSRV